jgi:hypothetical protein
VSENIKYPTFRVAFDKEEWISIAPGARHKTVACCGKLLRIVEFTPDFHETDWCLKGHIGYVLEGALEIDFDGRPIQYQTGDGIFILAENKNRHKARSLTDVVRLFLVDDI